MSLNYLCHRVNSEKAEQFLQKKLDNKGEIGDFSFKGV